MRVYDVVSLLFSARGPRPDRPDQHVSREVSARRVLGALLDEYGADDDQRGRAPAVMATFADSAADYLVELGRGAPGAGSVEQFDAAVTRRRFVAAWWREQASL